MNDSNHIRPRRIVQLTDCHLAFDRSFRLGGVEVWPRFLAVLEDIRRRVDTCDLLVLTGDLTHDNLEATYALIADYLRPWQGKYWILPGNHDDRIALLKTFCPPVQPVPDRLVYWQKWERWQVMGLDTLEPGQDWGHLGAPQRRWLVDVLERSRSPSVVPKDGLTPSPTLPLPSPSDQGDQATMVGNLPMEDALPNQEQLGPRSTAGTTGSQPESFCWTVIFLHHPPLRVNCEWLDSIGLQDQSALIDVLLMHPEVRLVIGGHVHQEASFAVGSVVVLTTPAVGPQFRPRAPVVTMESGPPKYRLIELYPDGQWFSQVWQVDMS